MPILGRLTLTVLALVISVAADAQQRQIALSFDDVTRGDGPEFTGSERADRLLEELDRVTAQGALFFVTTSNLERRGEEGLSRVRRYVSAGHRLANHSHNHLHPRQTTVEAYLADIDRASRILTRFDGLAQPDGAKMLFRFPFLNEGPDEAWRDAVRAGLSERRLANGYVTVDTYDWYMAALFKEAVEAGHPVDKETLGAFYVRTLLESVEFYDAVAQEALGRSPKHILLLHENDLAALFVGDLVEALRDSGWAVIPAMDAYSDPIAHAVPDTMHLSQGRVAAIAHVKGRDRKSLVHESEDEDFLRRRFLELGLLPAN